MNLFPGGKLNPLAFDEDIRRGTHDLNDVLTAAVNTQSSTVESTHFLIALARLSSGVTQRGLARRSLSVEQWESGLSSCALKGTGARPTQLARTSLHDSAVAMLDAIRERCVLAGLTHVSEPLLLLCALQHLTTAVRALFTDPDVDLDLDQWCAELEDVITPPPAIAVFAREGKQKVLLDVFSSSGEKILLLLQTETQALGYPTADPRHLLLALLAWKGGATHYAIHLQGQKPEKVQEAVMLNLRAQAKRTLSAVTLDRDQFQPILQHILELAGEIAGRERADRVAEPHLLRAFLAVDSTARRLLADQKLNITELRTTAEGYDLSAEKEEEGSAGPGDVETVRKRLRQRLVGQDEAIEQILPYIEFMRLGLTTPGHPVGVFLFCGQSGSGKTEMAKELARAVYGTEENLIFLEMGQFNSPESMNIFVGAPPGYIGYGEGKLTNGLRDKPQAVVLFDEVEKADPKVLDALLRFLDEGRIDDPAGPVRDGSRCIVILTSNVGADEMDQLWKRVADLPNQRTEIRRELRAEFKKHKFRVEFLNRVDEVILFHTLTRADYIEIARRYLAWYGQFLPTALLGKTALQVEMVCDPEVAVVIGGYCAEINEGARLVHRLTRATVVLPVCRFVLQHLHELQTYTPPIRLNVWARREPEGEPIGEVEFG